MPPANDAHFDASNSAAGPDKSRVPTPATPNWPWVWLLFLAVVNLIGPFLPIPNPLAALLGTVGLTTVYVGAFIAFSLGVARLKLPVSSTLLWLSFSALVWLTVVFGAMPLLHGMLRRSDAIGIRPSHMLRFIDDYALPTLQSLALLSTATFAGSILARLIRYPNMLGPIGGAVAIIDTWGVLFGGPVSQMLNNKAMQPVVDKAMTASPKLGAVSAARTGFFIQPPAIGVGDFFFVALFLSVLVNLAMNWKTSARLMWILVVLELLLIQLLPLMPLLPGLIAIGAAAVLPNLKFFKFTREEGFALLYTGIFLVILAIGIHFIFPAVLPKDQTNLVAPRPAVATQN